MPRTSAKPLATTVDASEEPATGVCAPRGFRASGVHCGIRRKRSDLALIVSDRTAAAAAVFTTNRAQAAPVLVSREHLEVTGGVARAIVVNAGNANACTGEPGLAAARLTAARTAELLGVPPAQVLVASTGVIGERLPVERLLSALPDAVAGLSASGGTRAAGAILTTDLRLKECARTVSTPRGSFTIGGMAKGSGMIHPDMATTLGFVTTDAAVEPGFLRLCLRRAADLSFNRITVDGDTSTNDTLVVLANGASRVKFEAPRSSRFEEALTEVLTELAKMVARDGEGATKLITVEVEGAATEADALAVARAIAGSSLVKTAVGGADANWGRIVAAAGRAGVAIDPERLSVSLGGVEVLKPGFASVFSEDAARRALEQEQVTLSVDLGSGRARATTWTCDLTAGYIVINSGYRT